MSKLREIIDTQLDAARARGILDERTGFGEKQPMITDLKVHTEQQIKDLMLEIVGEDTGTGKSRVTWGGDGSVKAENADDLREGWNNKLKAKQRQKINEL